MTTDVRGARIVRLLQDPAVGGDLLLVAMALSAKYDFGLDTGGTLDDVAALLWPGRPVRSQRFQIEEVLRRDIRTYKPPRLENKCTAPMQRRSGLCGRNATLSGYVVDWATGEKHSSGGCGRHLVWAHQAHRENWAAKPPDPPLPHANHGGVLRVHFPLLNWNEFWGRLDPQWRRHPERTTWPKPTLRLLLGDGDGLGERPLLLSVVPVGGQP